MTKCPNCENCIKDLRTEVKRLHDLYYELIMAVGKKYPNETRHQTALRYIIEKEEINYSTAKESINEERRDSLKKERE